MQLLAGKAADAPAKAQQLLQDSSAVTELPLAVLLDLVETMVVYKLPSMSREEVRRMLELHDIDLRQTRFYQEVFAEGEARGEVRLLQKPLNRRFGILPDWVETKLAAAEPAQLEIWGERVLEARSLCVVSPSICCASTAGVSNISFGLYDNALNFDRLLAYQGL